ncbi:MAG: hypothetical protein KJZ84_14375 [Bryobacteraceae bacterium]|nr:hypothetical protein [Bryobacteraceae bacterium]
MRILVALLFSAAACAAGAELQLSTDDGRTRFYIGEAIRLHLRFVIDAQPGLHLNTTTGARTSGSHMASLDEFTVEPADGVVDPLVSRIHMGSAGSLAFFGTGSSDIPITVKLYLNEWFSFRKPGQYTVRLKSNRLQRNLESKTPEPIPLEANPIEIEIAEPPQAWAAQVVVDARAVLGSASDEHSIERKETLARLQYLETPEAAMALVAFSANSGDVEATRALWPSPHRKLVLEEMERLLEAPGVPVHSYWLHTLAELAASAEMPEGRRADVRDWNRLVSTHKGRYTERLLAALPRKQGEARAISVLTLHGAGVPIPPEELREILLSGPPEKAITRPWFFSGMWPVLASPEMGPFLEQAAFPGGELAAKHERVEAIHRFYEIDAARARRRILEEIRTAPPQSLVFRYFFLPDRELPELDEFFVERLKQPNPLWLHIARYGTRTLLPAVLSALDSGRGACLVEPILYLLRVAPEEGRRRYEAYSEPGANGPQCGRFEIPGDPRNYMNDALEDILISRLESDDMEVRNQAAFVLGNAGTARAEAPLWRAMERWRESVEDGAEKLSPAQQSEEGSLSQALATPRSWVVSPDRAERLERLCVSERCRATVRAFAHQPGQPVHLNLIAGAGPRRLHIGRHAYRFPEDLRARIPHYPRATVFSIHLAQRDTWYISTFERELQSIFDELGYELQVIDMHNRPI